MINVRVVETYDLKGNHEYACLSYCWGSAHQASSTKTASFPRVVAITDLPKTISDAICLCYALNIQYLWVDSLCIIQGDAADWQRESAKMCDIYGRSALTIATEICNTSTQSFVDQRKDRNYFSGPRIMLKNADQPLSPRKSICFREKDNKHKNSPWAAEVAWNVLNYFNTDQQIKAWRTRAWTFQEWMISPRVLHIDKMTLWHCFEGYGNEMGQRTMAPAILHRNLQAYTNEILWKDIVRNYTARKLTNDSDRLPALDGIVQLYQERIGHTYLAGLWLEEMPKSLLWKRRAHNSKRSSGFNKGLIPSWSWASVETMVHEETFNWDFVHTSVRSYFYKCEPPDSLSHIREAWLELEGPLILVMSCQRAERSTQDLWWLRADGVQHGGINDLVSLDAHDKEFKDDVAVGRIYLLVIGRTTDSSYRTLALRKVGSASRINHFQRVGAGEIYRKILCKYEQKIIRIV